MEFVWTVLTGLMLLLMLAGFIFTIYGLIAWIRRASRPKPTPDLVIFGWRAEDGKLRWTLNRPNSPSVDLTNKP